MSDFEPTARTSLRRHRERGRFDRDQVYSILDEAFICHVAASVDGTVHVLPTAYGRRDERLFLHGAAANHLIKAAADGAELTINVTLVDGLVLARSVFNHSLNYRSVVIFAQAIEVTDPAAKAAALACITDHMLPGRTAEARNPAPSELKATRVVSIDLEEVSAKVRSGPPVDEDGDEGLAVWAGVIPLRTVAGPLVPDPANQAGLPEPVGAHQPDRWGAWPTPG